MLPTNEIDALKMTVVEAVDRAVGVQLADGHTALLTGPHRAEQIAQGGIDW